TEEPPGSFAGKKRARVLDKGIMHVECRNSSADPVYEAKYHAASPQSPNCRPRNVLSGSWSTALDNLHIIAWAQRHRRHRPDRRTGRKPRRNLPPPGAIHVLTASVHPR